MHFVSKLFMILTCCRCLKWRRICRWLDDLKCHQQSINSSLRLHSQTSTAHAPQLDLRN
ncbi:hypothetical protein KC19_VG323900 [Ceratodon purpureus]|uniref:Uncharacterized protein n=1 Tax=Ceratodon purpureus TaxID=3225 RepID=A0A8T0HVR9_CERPU|nr:hypothetical protein KC19_VG323900 [Ceratodon purpureus]